jgi:hypothetical protein
MRRGLDRAGHFEKQIYSAASGQDPGIVGQHGTAACDFRFRFASGFDATPFGYARFSERALAMGWRPIGYSDKANTGSGRSKLKGDGSTRCASANHSNSDWPA